VLAADAVCLGVAVNVACRSRLAEQYTVSYTVSDMKKIPSRQFQKAFGKLARALKPGQVVQITEFGKPLVQVTPVGQSPVKLPDFAANLKTAGAQESAGERILREYYDSLS
jgi:antitoxin (DNA-binding transcriptional repressor) of toxin-antitoxin stability system